MRPQIGANFGDVDLFLVGHPSDAAACAAIVALRDHLAGASWPSSGPSQGPQPPASGPSQGPQPPASGPSQGPQPPALRVHRTLGCITFICTDYAGAPARQPRRKASAPRRQPCALRVVQVILRRYSTLAEVLHGFDLGACAVAWDGARVSLTALGRLAARWRVNVVNLAVRRGSYERRLVRYWERGFAVALPDFDPATLPPQDRYLISLPYLYSRVIPPGVSRPHCSIGSRAADIQPRATDIQPRAADIQPRAAGLLRVEELSARKSDVDSSPLYDWGAPNYANVYALMRCNLDSLRQHNPFVMRLVATHDADSCPLGDPGDLFTCGVDFVPLFTMACESLQFAVFRFLFGPLAGAAASARF